MRELPTHVSEDGCYDTFGDDYVGSGRCPECLMWFDEIEATLADIREHIMECGQ